MNQMLRKICGLTAVLSLCAISGVYAADNIQTSGSKPESGTMDPQHAQTAVLSTSDVLERLHHTNQEEIHAGQNAISKGVAPQLKNFGKILVRDHTMADKLVTTLAKNKSLSLGEPEPKTFEERKQMQTGMQTMQRLEAMSRSSDWDRQFSQAMLEDHNKDIAMVRSVRDSTKDMELKTLLSQLLPKLEQHKDIAAKLVTQLGNVRTPASSDK